MIYQTKDNRGLVVTCSCGCNNGLVIRRDEDGDIWMNMVQSKFYSEQKTLFRRIKEKVKRVWSVLRDKEYVYFDVHVKSEEFEEFQEYVANL